MKSTQWRTELVQRLIANVHADGGWGYRTDTRSSAEPTAMAALALASCEHGSDLSDRALAWLESTQASDGSVAASSNLPTVCWPTAIAILAWVRAAGGAQTHSDRVVRATESLLRTSGTPSPINLALMGHDTTLIGWSWIENTHSWVEPTAHAILALRVVGRSDHERVRAATHLLIDRMIPGGGWNYGNTRVLENTLRPFPATTGLALAALSGLVDASTVQRSIDYLTSVLPRVRSPLSLGWGLIGLTAWNARPTSADDWLAEAAFKSLRRRPSFLDDSVLLLAAHEHQWLTRFAHRGVS